MPKTPTTSSPVTLKVTGLRATTRALEAAGADAADLRAVMGAVGDVVLPAAAALIPRRTGTLLATLRAGRTKSKAVIRLGGARAPYAGVVHYGSPDGARQGNLALPRAIAAREAQIIETFDRGFGQLLDRHNL